MCHFPRAEKQGSPHQPARPAPSPHPHPQADAGTLSCKLAKASLRGEGWGEGAFAEALSRIWYHR